MVGFHDRCITLQYVTHWLSFLSTSRILLYSLLGSIELIRPRSTAPTQKHLPCVPFIVHHLLPIATHQGGYEIANQEEG